VNSSPPPWNSSGNDAGEVRAVVVAETEYRDGGRFPKPGTEREIPADLVLLALGYRGAEHENLTSQLSVWTLTAGETWVARSTTAPRWTVYLLPATPVAARP
jgi:NADPH-dependent glutamate synthase beta subunit-like oxidoreductase